MSRPLRGVLLALGALGFAAVVLWGLRGLPPVGHYRGPYGDVLNRVSVPERHATDVVTAVNFDYRGIDTLGEEFILFASVIGVALLLRTHPDEVEGHGELEEDQIPGRELPPPSSAVRLLGFALVPLVVLFGIYVVTHGQLTPGGGFQGGVLLATGPLLVYLVAYPRLFDRIAPHGFVELGEALGAGAFAAIGFAGLIAAGAFLQNFLPIGPDDANILSGGTIALISAATGLEVAGGFVLVLSVFVHELARRRAVRP